MNLEFVAALKSNGAFTHWTGWNFKPDPDHEWMVLDLNKAVQINKDNQATEAVHEALGKPSRLTYIHGLHGSGFTGADSQGFSIGKIVMFQTLPKELETRLKDMKIGDVHHNHWPR